MLEIYEELDPCLVGVAVISNNQCLIQCSVADACVSLNNMLFLGISSLVGVEWRLCLGSLETPSQGLSTVATKSRIVVAFHHEASNLCSLLHMVV